MKEAKALAFVNAYGVLRTLENLCDMVDEAKAVCAGLKKPVALCFDVNDGPCVTYHCSETLRIMTDHLIKEHGCKKLWCIAGFEGEIPSLERLRGFTDAMQEAGLPIAEDAIHFGHYWRPPIIFLPTLP